MTTKKSPNQGSFEASGKNCTQILPSFTTGLQSTKTRGAAPGKPLPARDGRSRSWSNERRAFVGTPRISLDGEAEVISDKHHYWHPGARLDGGMICSETLSPDLGLFKIDPVDGTDEKICLTKSSNSHPQWTHPHPTWSPDGRELRFWSGRGGEEGYYIIDVESREVRPWRAADEVSWYEAGRAPDSGRPTGSAGDRASASGRVRIRHNLDLA